MLLMSSEILLFKGKDYSNKNKLGLLNFTHNADCKPIKTYPIRTMPIAFYSKGENLFLADKISHTNKIDFKVYYSS